MGWPKTVQPVLSKELSQDLNVRLDTTRRHRSLPALISGSQELGRPMRVLWLARSPRGYVTEGSYPPRVLKEFNNLHTSDLGWGQFRRTWRRGGKQLHIERLSVSCWYLLTDQDRTTCSPRWEAFWKTLAYTRCWNIRRLCERAQCAAIPGI